MLEFCLGHSKMYSTYSSVRRSVLAARIARAERYVHISAQAFFSVRDGFSACPCCACKMLLLVSRHWPMGENPREHAVKVWERLARGISGFGQDAVMRRT